MDYQDGRRDPPVDQLFDQFINACTCKTILSTFHQLIDILELKHVSHRQFYRRLRSRITSWKAQSLWARLDKRASLKEYKKGEACANTRVLVIGSGPCGLRTAIELAFLGAKVVIVEKRDSFSRNNVLHLWPYLITDLKNLGAKKFFGKFCAGAIDHISIRQLQCILMKVALLLGVEIDVNVSFEGLIEPTENKKTGWKCQVLPKDHPVSEYEFDVLVGADGKRNTLEGFKRKEFRGKLAIAITANFINRNTQAEARVEEISGVAFIFNQKFFKDLNAKSGIDLENIVYYKDDTHYFVMTAKKWSLLDRGVLREDFADTAKLLHPQNISRDALQLYATDAANFSTNFQLPHLEFAINHYGQPDVAMFDFTSMFAALNASRVIEKHGHKLIVTLVGDSLLEPFWPTGSGCARGFLGAFDTAWMVRCWASGRMTPLQVIAQRESIYQLLSQTTPENLNRNYSEYTIDPNTRYPNLNLGAIKAEQVRHLYDSDDVHFVDEIIDIPVKRIRNDETIVDSYTILRWCQRLLNTGKFKNVQVQDLTFSWKNGMALCALIHCFKPELINLDELCPSDIAENNQLAFDIAQKELGISPVMTGQDMANCTAPDKLTMMSYLSCFFQKFRKERTPSDPIKTQERQKSHRSPHHRLSILQKLRVSTRFSRSKKKKEEEKNEINMNTSLHSLHGKKKYRDITMNGDVHSAKHSKLPMDEIANKLAVSQGVDKGGKEELQTKVKVSEMAEILVSKFKTTVQAPAPTPNKKKPPGILLGAQPASEICFFCKKRVYLMERMNAEGVFFHRGCLKCDFCETGLRMNNYSCERTPMTGQVKFYCFRHNKPELRVTRVKRKRIFYEEDENSKENIPKIVIETGPGGNQSPEKRLDGSPKKKPLPLTPPLAPPVDYLDKRTPERIEFENSIDGLPEESEEELTEHNLRASLSSDAILDEPYSSDDSDLESSDEEELQEVVNETIGCNKDLTLEEALKVVETLKRKSHENLLEAVANEAHHHHHHRSMEVDNDDEEENTEVEEDEEGSEYDSDGEEDDSGTEEEDLDKDIPMTNGNDASNKNKTDNENGQQSSTTDQPNSSHTTSSPSALKSARANFFVSPAEVVRLDPFKMFGMGKKPESNQKEESENKVVSEEKVDQIESENENTDNQVKEQVLDEGSLKDEVKGQDTDLEEEVEDVFEENSDEDELERTAVHEQMKLLLEKPESGDVKSDEDDVFVGESNGNLSDDEQEPREVILGDRISSLDEPEDQIMERSFDNIDDKFVTRNRRGGLRRGRKLKRTKRNSFGSNSSFTISTPSNSQGSSLSSLSMGDANQPLQYEGDGEDEDMKPDEDLLKEYQLTLSQALGEEYSDDHEDSPRQEERPNLDDTLNAVEQDSSENRNSSVYLTPESSLTEKWMSQSKAVTSSDKTDAPGGSVSENVSGNSVSENLKSPVNSNLSKKSENNSSEYSGFTWRPLPPLPDGSEKLNSEKTDKSCENKKETKKLVPVDNNKQESNRKLPDISNLTSKINPQGFQSKFMRNKLGSPTSSSQKTTDTDSTKESSSSPEMKKSKFQNKSPVTPVKNNVSPENKLNVSNSATKTKISVDHAKLKSLSSFENDSSSQTEDKGIKKKKIGVDANLKNRIKPKLLQPRTSVGDNINDIPFADDSDDAVNEKEKFYTPAAPSGVKAKLIKKDAKTTTGQKDVRKRILPTPPKHCELPPTPSASHIRDLKKSEMESARLRARQKARLKSDEELGLQNMDYTPIAGDKGHRAAKPGRAHSTPSTSDIMSDSSDINNLHFTPIASEKALVHTPKDKKKKKKDKEKIGTPKSSDMSDSDGKVSSKKKKSFLQMFKPHKSADKSKDWKDKDSRSSSLDTLDEKTEKKKKKTPKSEKKKKKAKSESCDNSRVDVDLSDNLKDLKIGAMFQDKGRLYKPNAKRPGYAVRRYMPPKAEMDEFSDSGDSFRSTDTTLSRKSKERRALSESELNVRIARRVQSAARKQLKQREQKRLRMAQEIQRQLQEVDVKQRELEERGVIVEKALRGEGPDAEKPESELMQEWFNLVYEKNALVRYESELMVNAQYMELEDRHGRLEQELRERMVTDNKGGKQDEAEKQILDELLQVVEERDNLILMLEEDRVREQEEDKDLRAMMKAKGFDLSPMDYTRQLKDSCGFPLSC